ncbi:LamB/YcsF family protein [Corynebacterium sp. sy039]|uniref:LamB/YcsF family protein n=1 Tax=Corynebacterium sp. sy039 TaxID=2599641 RepID=UPI0011B496D4|nr:5-oxoprolinase subunit PxpA [Corynebacterium sp. sy039]QDZ42297.1 LamB/YcsF family protein [Corynebacterium sp. sy039]
MSFSSDAQPKSTQTFQIDLNADLGESFGNYHLGCDDDLLTLISSANIACGFHAGDPITLLRTVKNAHDNGVRIGAHPGYRDLAGFGRRRMDYSYTELYAEIIYQLGAIDAAARSTGARLEYVKPHGALYNTIAHDEQQARAVIDAIINFNPQLKLMALAGSQIVHWAQKTGLQVIQEAFADRAYTNQGTLVPRSQQGAVHTNADVVIAQALALATQQPVQTSDGSSLLIQADSICVHGDNPQALLLVQQIKKELSSAGVQISA